MAVVRLSRLQGDRRPAIPRTSAPAPRTHNADHRCVLLVLLAEPLRQLARDALADLSEGITAEQRAKETKRLNAEIVQLEAKLQEQQDAAKAAGVTL